MNIDPNVIWIAAGAIVVLAIIGLFARGLRRARTSSLREKFGSEYDHACYAGGRAGASSAVRGSSGYFPVKQAVQ